MHRFPNPLPGKLYFPEAGTTRPDPPPARLDDSAASPLNPGLQAAAMSVSRTQGKW
jgi:hypothetical protein